MRKMLVIAARLAAVVAAAYGFQVLCVGPYRCSQAVAEVEARSRMALTARDPSLATLMARRNLARLETVRHSCTQDVAWHMLYAGNLRLLERNEEAVNEYSTALTFGQRPELYLQRGLTKLALGQVEAAIPDLTAAARFSPSVIEQLDGETKRRVGAAIQR